MFPNFGLQRCWKMLDCFTHDCRLSDRNMRFLPQLISGKQSLYKPPYRRCRAGKRVRERASKSFLSISKIDNLPRQDSASYLHKLKSKVDHSTITNHNFAVNHQNLRTLPRTNKILQPSKCIKFANVNPRSVKNKTADIVDHVIGNNIDVCVITETWMKERDTVASTGLSVNGYCFKHVPRQSDRQGGGTGLLYRNTLKAKLICGGEKKSFEYSEWNINISNRNVKVTAIYRPPYSVTHPISSAMFFEEFSLYLENIVMCSEILLIAGDFNFHLDNQQDNDTKRFQNILHTFGLTQHVSVPTHRSGHILDLVITRSSNDLIVDTPQAGLAISDHFFIECKLSLPRPPLKVAKLQFRNFKRIDLAAFKEDIRSLDLVNSSQVSLDDLATHYHQSLLDILDKHAPCKTKVMVIRPKVPWFTNDLKELKALRRKFEKKSLKSSNPLDKQTYNTVRNKYSVLLNKAREIYYTELIDKCAGDTRKLFRVVNSMCKESVDMDLPPHTDTCKLANDFGEFFIKKVDMIKDKIAGIITDDPVVETSSCNVKFADFPDFSVDDISTIISKSSNATCALDPIPSWLTKECCEVLSPVITRLINQSLQEGIVPDTWKTALVVPLLKKAGLDATFNNYRPVSNLSFISKILEKAVATQLLAHCTNNAPLPVNQSSYRQYHSTETALLKVQSDILMNMDKQEITLLVMLDLSAAFDTVDHTLLTDILEKDFGVTDIAKSWLESYLSNRKQRIVIKDSVSDNFDLNCGVPQGSCLGPILFLLYASRLFQVIAKHLPAAHGYADDTQLYLSFKPDSLLSGEKAVQDMENCISDVRSWMFSNELMINDTKTEFIIIGSRQQLLKVNISSVKVGGADISPVKCVRNLGAWFDCTMSMDTHINKICSKAFRGLYNIRQIRKFLTPSSTKTLVHAFVTSHLDYCNSLLFGLPNYQYDRLQKVLNAAARVIFLIPKFHHITPTLIYLHWLPIKFRIQFKILLLVYKCLHNKAPKYLSDLIIIKTPGRYNLRKNQQTHLMVPQTNRISFGDRSFACAGPMLWNLLPMELKQVTSIDVFKANLKTHLFKKAYQDNP